MPTQNEFDNLLSYDGVNSNAKSSDSNLQKNQNLNRAVNGVLPFDENRVILKSTCDKTDYINASWISDPATDQTYDIAKIYLYIPTCQMGLICSQIPNKDGIDQYYQMIIEKRIELVMHFSESVELLKEDDILNNSLNSKTMISREEISDFLDKEHWKIKNDLMSHELKYFRFKGWPAKEHLGSDTIRKMLTTISIIRKEIGPKDGISWYSFGVNIVIQDDHGGCSAAAIFISLLFLLEKVDGAMPIDSLEKNMTDSPPIDICKTVNELRSKRMKMITCLEEYKFLYQCIMHYVHYKNEYDEMIKRKDTKSDEGSSNDKKLDQSAIVDDKTKDKIDDEVESEYVISDETNSIRAELIHDEGDYFDGYKVYS